MLAKSLAGKKTILEILLTFLALAIHCCGTITPSKATGAGSVDNAIGVESLSRSKRYLLWNPASVVQITVALAIPMKDVKEKSKNVGVAYDIQGNYPMPIRIAQLEPGYIPVAPGSRRIVRDISLQDAYTSFEEILYGQGFDGRACLMQAICMVAEIPISRDSLHEEIIHLLLTPAEMGSGVAARYKEAQDLGETGIDCRAAFSDCKTPLLDAISRIWNPDPQTYDDRKAFSDAETAKTMRRPGPRDR